MPSPLSMPTDTGRIRRRRTKKRQNYDQNESFEAPTEYAIKSAGPDSPPESQSSCVVISPRRHKTPFTTKLRERQYHTRVCNEEYIDKEKDNSRNGMPWLMQDRRTDHRTTEHVPHRPGSNCYGSISARVPLIQTTNASLKAVECKVPDFSEEKGKRRHWETPIYGRRPNSCLRFETPNQISTRPEEWPDLSSAMAQGTQNTSDPSRQTQEHRFRPYEKYYRNRGRGRRIPSLVLHNTHNHKLLQFHERDSYRFLNRTLLSRPVTTPHAVQENWVAVRNSQNHHPYLFSTGDPTETFCHTTKRSLFIDILANARGKSPMRSERTSSVKRQRVCFCSLLSSFVTTFDSQVIQSKVYRLSYTPCNNTDTTSPLSTVLQAEWSARSKFNPEIKPNSVTEELRDLLFGCVCGFQSPLCGPWSQQWQQHPDETDVRNLRLSSFKTHFGDFISLTRFSSEQRPNKAFTDEIDLKSFRWWEFPYRSSDGVSKTDLVLTTNGSLLSINWETGQLTASPRPPFADGAVQNCKSTEGTKVNFSGAFNSCENMFETDSNKQKPTLLTHKENMFKEDDKELAFLDTNDDKRRTNSLIYQSRQSSCENEVCICWVPEGKGWGLNLSYEGDYMTYWNRESDFIYNYAKSICDENQASLTGSHLPSSFVNRKLTTTLAANEEGCRGQAKELCLCQRIIGQVKAEIVMRLVALSCFGLISSELVKAVCEILGHIEVLSSKGFSAPETRNGFSYFSNDVKQKPADVSLHELRSSTSICIFALLAEWTRQLLEIWNQAPLDRRQTSQAGLDMKTPFDALENSICPAPIAKVFIPLPVAVGFPEGHKQTRDLMEKASLVWFKDENTFRKTDQLDQKHRLKEVIERHVRRFLFAVVVSCTIPDIPSNRFSWGHQYDASSDLFQQQYTSATINATEQSGPPFKNTHPLYGINKLTQAQIEIENALDHGFGLGNNDDITVRSTTWDTHFETDITGPFGHGLKDRPSELRPDTTKNGTFFEYLAPVGSGIPSSGHCVDRVPFSSLDNRSKIRNSDHFKYNVQFKIPSVAMNNLFFNNRYCRPPFISKSNPSAFRPQENRFYVRYPFPPSKLSRATTPSQCHVLNRV